MNRDIDRNRETDRGTDTDADRDMDRDRKKDRGRNRDIDRNRDTDQLLSVDTGREYCTNHDRDVLKLNVLHSGPSSYLTDFPLVSVPCYPSSMTKNDETTLIFIRTAV
jgi:hypothetical protein